MDDLIGQAIQFCNVIRFGLWEVIEWGADGIIAGVIHMVAWVIGVISVIVEVFQIEAGDGPGCRG